MLESEIMIMDIQMKVTNFRDLGGITTKQNRKIKPKKILRSGELVNIPEYAKHILTNKYGLKRIIDMRGDQEIIERPDDSFDTVKYQQIDILKDVADENASLEEFSKLDPKVVDQHMTKLYHDLILTKGAREGYHQFLADLSTLDDGSLLFHCFAGKDRTGIGAALILSLLEVPEDKIMEDYLLTNQLRKHANEQIIEEEKKKGLTPSQIEGLRISLCVRPEYLKTSYDLIRKEFGSVQNYAIEALDFSKQDINNLQSQFLE